MTMGDKIKTLRINKELTQEALGEMLGVNRAAVNKWETGQVENLKRTTIIRLSQILGCTPCELMCFDEDTKASQEQIDDFENRFNSDNQNMNEVQACEMLQKFYGKEAFELIKLYLELNEQGKQIALATIKSLSCNDDFADKR